MPKRYQPHAHCGLTGPLDPTLERAHLFDHWDKQAMLAAVPAEEARQVEPPAAVPQV